MDSDGIVPDIIDVAPQAVAQVSYTSGFQVYLGRELTPVQVKDEPEVVWIAEKEALYTLILVDPDAPSRENPTWREVCHWLVINIPGKRVGDGQTVVEFVGSGPEKGSGLHRYVFLIFKQTDKIFTEHFIPKTNLDGRLNTKVRDYITKYNLGNPVAGNYYVAQYDDYVPILHASFSKV